MSLLSRRSKSTKKAARRRRPSLRPDFELLEDRRLLAPLNFLVTNNADSGPGSLRQAIIDANTTSGADTIGFNIAVGAISETAIPKPSSTPIDNTAGPDGNLWFTERDANQIGRITPAGAITEFRVPTTNSDPIGITAGPDGNLWFTERSANQIGRITPVDTTTSAAIVVPVNAVITTPGGTVYPANSTIPSGTLLPTGTIAEYAILTTSSYLGEITAGPDGNLWFTERSANANQIGRITPTGAITEFRVPTTNSDPIGITAGPDGNLWFTEANGNQIGRITPVDTTTSAAIVVPVNAVITTPGGTVYPANSTIPSGTLLPTGTIAEYAIPTTISGPIPSSDPVDITAGPDGNLWFTERSANQIGRITPAGIIAEYAIPKPNSAPEGITAGPDGNLWFAEDLGNQIGRITPSGIIAEYAIPTPGSTPVDITAGPDGNLWFTELNGNKIGRVTVSSAGLTISPLSELPTITDPVVIDGYTQPGASPNTLAVGDNAVLLIDLSGASAGIGVDGLVISAGGSTVRGLIINDFVAGPSTPGFIPNGGKGISLGTAGGNTIVGNFIGTDPSGGIAQPNTFSGVLTTTAGNQIGGTAPGTATSSRATTSASSS